MSAPTQRPTAPADDAPAGVPTVVLPPPDPVAPYLRKRAAIDALWAECDALWDGMSERQRDHVASALTTPPRRGRG